MGTLCLILLGILVLLLIDHNRSTREHYRKNPPPLDQRYMTQDEIATGYYDRL